MEQELKNKLNSLSPQQLRELMKKAGKERKELPLMPRNAARQYPVSSAQKRMWFLSKLDPASHLYTNPIGIRIKTKNEIDIDLYVHGFHQIVQRHEIMRTSFFMSEGRILQQVHEQVEVQIDKMDLRSYPESEKQAIVEEVLAKDGQTVIGIEDFPLFKFRQLVLSDREFVLLYNSHHIISDAWSSSHIFREMQTLYEMQLAGGNAELPPARYQFIDYVHWENQWFETEEYKQASLKWESLLPVAPEPLRLPLDFVRPPVIDYTGGLEKITLDAALTSKLSEFSKKENVNLFHTLLAAFNILLHKYSGNEEIVVGIPFANRKLREFQQTVGMFLNTLPHRTAIDTTVPFETYLQQVKEVSQAMVAHQDFPFEKIVERINPPRDVAITPIFQVLFVFQNIPNMYQWENLEVSPVKPDYHISKYEINLWIEEVAGSLLLSLTYQTRLFTKETIQRYLQYYQLLLEAVIEHADLPIAELMVGKTVAPDYAETTTGSYLASFEKHAVTQSDAPALLCGEERFSYRELNEQANQLAQYLLLQKTGNIIAFMLPRSAVQIIAILAIHKAGCAYLPVDPAITPERLDILINDAGIGLMVTTEQYSSKFNESGLQLVLVDVEQDAIRQCSTGNMGVTVHTNDIAYLLYTSGTTGSSKGVCIEHAQLFNYSQAVWQRFKLDAFCLFATVSGITTDLGNTQIFPPLMHGAAIDMVPGACITDAALLSSYMQGHAVDCLKIVPSHLSSLLRARPDANMLPSKLLILGGESVTATLVQEIRALRPGLRIINHYGPTETTIGILTHEIGNVEHNSIIPLGMPLNNNNVFIVDAQHRVLPDGLPGEILVCGLNVGRGYYNNEALTQAAFSFKCYKTGDLGRKRPDGNIDFLGRKDRQVKIRGFRVEPDAIERTILKNKKMTGAFVTDRDGLSLIAFITVQDDGAAVVQQLKQQLYSALPSYMVPEEIVIVAEFPRHSNGKIAIRSLLETKTAIYDEQKPIQPRDETELGISMVWSAVLKKNSFSINDNFFSVGGTSLIALEVIAKINRQFGTELGIGVLFEHNTIQSIAALIRNGQHVTGNSPLLLLKRGTSNQYLFLVHAAGGDVLSYYELASRIDDACHVYGLQSNDLENTDASIEALATRYLDALKQQLPGGNYVFSGWSMGAIVAFEMALQYEGDPVPVIILDQRAPANHDQPTLPALELQVEFARKIELLTGRKNNLDMAILEYLTAEERTALFLDVFKEGHLVPEELKAADFQGFLDKMMDHHQITACYRGAVYNGPVVLIKAAESDAGHNWDQYAENLVVETVPGNHVTIIRPPHVQALAEKINDIITATPTNTHSYYSLHSK